MLGPEESVAWMFKAMTQPLSEVSARGAYGWYSNRSHPTLYSISRLWATVERDGATTLVVAGAEDCETEIRVVVTASYEALSFVWSYHGWPRERHDQLTGEIERVLPSLFVETRQI
jgi:hypothetical protein